MRSAWCVMVSLVLLSACSSEPTRGSVCDRVGPASCEQAIRCSSWDGTQADCERVARYECCERDGTCGDEVIVDAELLETCTATIRGAECGTSPLSSEVCRDAVREPPPASIDAGPELNDAATVDAAMADAFVPTDAAPSRLYASCAGSMSCGAGEDCYTLSYESTDFACTRPCTGPDDTSCSGGHCVRTRTAPRGMTAVDGTAVCLRECTVDLDCLIPGWTCVATTTGFRICLP